MWERLICGCEGEGRAASRGGTRGSGRNRSVEGYVGIGVLHAKNWLLMRLGRPRARN